MFNVEISSEYRVYTVSGSKGSQVKYFKDDFWYKEDNLGVEGFVEYLVSIILKHSSLKSNEYTVYDYGIINGKDGCRSKDFTNHGQFTFKTLQNLYNQITGGDLYSKVRSIDDFSERRDFVLDFFNKYYNYNLTNYFSKIFTLDLITLNEDRHFSNLGILICNDSSITDAPLFDNGMSLLNGNYSVNRHFNIEDNTKRVTSKPFSGSPVTQYKLFNHGFYLDYIGLFQELKTISTLDSFYKDVLEYQLLKYKDIFFKYKMYNLVYNGTVIGTRIKTCRDIYDTRQLFNDVKDNIYVSLNTVSNQFVSKGELNSGKVFSEVDSSIIDKLFGI